MVGIPIFPTMYQTLGISDIAISPHSKPSKLRMFLHSHHGHKSLKALGVPRNWAVQMYLYINVSDKHIYIYMLWHSLPSMSQALHHLVDKRFPSLDAREILFHPTGCYPAPSAKRKGHALPTPQVYVNDVFKGESSFCCYQIIIANYLHQFFSPGHVLDPIPDKPWNWGPEHKDWDPALLSL